MVVLKPAETNSYYKKEVLVQCACAGRCCFLLFRQDVETKGALLEFFFNYKWTRKNIFDFKRTMDFYLNKTEVEALVASLGKQGDGQILEFKNDRGRMSLFVEHLFLDGDGMVAMVLARKGTCVGEVVLDARQIRRLVVELKKYIATEKRKEGM